MASTVRLAVDEGRQAPQRDRPPSARWLAAGPRDSLASQIAEVQSEFHAWVAEPADLVAVLEELADPVQATDKSPTPTAVVVLAGEGRWRFREAMAAVDALRVLPVTAGWPALVIGPMLHRHVGCYECLLRRQLQFGSRTGQERVVAGTAAPLQALKGLAPAQMQLVSALVDSRLQRSGVGSSDVVAYDAADNEMTAYCVIPVAGCVTCRRRRQ